MSDDRPSRSRAPRRATPNEPPTQKPEGSRPLARRKVMAGVLGGATALGVAAAVGRARTEVTTPHPTPSHDPSREDQPVTSRQPTLYLPHGGGPCFFMEWQMGPANTWDRMRGWLERVGATLPERPKALLVVSAHWEQEVPTLTTRPEPTLLYDYYGFPPHTYELTWPAAHAPEVAARVQTLLSGAGIASATHDERGLDHGVFIPLKLSFPDADVPTVQLSLVDGLDPAQHLALGRALAPLRDEGVFIIGSGMSYHNMRGFGRASSLADSIAFDDWLGGAVLAARPEREAALAAWSTAPAARATHPREEHLLPLMVVAGAAGDDVGARVFSDEVMAVRVSAFQFG